VPFHVDAFAVSGNNLYILGNDRVVYAYGGADRNTYDNCEVRVRTPHLSMDKPNVAKKVQSVSAIVSGTWSLGLGMVTDNTDLFEPIATITGPTVISNRLGAVGHGTHVALEFVSAAPGPATISSAAIVLDHNEKL
jgi:hypothetical protein